MKKLFFGCVLTLGCTLWGEIQIIDGVKYECVDGMCMIVDDEAEGETENATNKVMKVSFPLPTAVAQGYMEANKFVAFLQGDAPQEMWLATDISRLTLWELLWVILAVLLGGFLMNLTPCVLPMIPINLMIIGKSATRGAWYGLGIAIAYGVLGVLASVGGLAFGTIQASPYFNLLVAIVFVVLAMALSGVFFIDLSKNRTGFAQKKQSMLPWLFAFFMGMMSAVMAGACVAPILIAVLLVTATAYAEGQASALALPFVLGLGMALPWPFLGAGMKVLPKPGGWMKWVNRVFAAVVLGFAVWYAHLAYLGFVGTGSATPAANNAGVLTATPETFAEQLAAAKAASDKPVLVDCWATWCKNCAAMDKVMENESVRNELGNYTVIRLQAEDMKALKRLEGFGEIRGLPAFVIF